MTKFGVDAVRQVLKNFGLTEKEVSTYIFLAKHGPLKGGEIAKTTKTQKAQVYRTLKSLQNKGLVEATLEAPTRFTAIQFENFIDMSIKAKQEEAALLRNTKNELVNDWKKIRQPPPELTLEKLLVIEGNHRIYPKIAQMIKETTNQLSVIATIPALIRAEQYGLFDTAFDHPLKSKIQFRFITELNGENLNSVKTLLRKIPKYNLKINGRNPDMGFQLKPRMIIRDEKEILFFITPRRGTLGQREDEVCLWTNCGELVQAFQSVFEDEWQKATDIEKKIAEIENCKLTAEAPIPSDAEIVRKNYEESMNTAAKEILILTSPEGLAYYSRKAPLVKSWVKKGISVRIMAPITSDNLKASGELSKTLRSKTRADKLLENHNH